MARKSLCHTQQVLLLETFTISFIASHWLASCLMEGRSCFHRGIYHNSKIYMYRYRYTMYKPGFHAHDSSDHKISTCTERKLSPVLWLCTVYCEFYTWTVLAQQQSLGAAQTQWMVECINCGAVGGQVPWHACGGLAEIYWPKKKSLLIIRS